MSLDEKFRPLLSRMVTSCRKELKEDITNQLQELYGLYPDGTSISIDKLQHLSSSQISSAQALRDLLDHFSASSPEKTEESRRSAFERLVLEISFTVLNRLAALRLCEERGIIVECIRKGMASDGFRVYESISGGIIGSRYEIYQAFLECLFDELALDLGILFDRTTPHSIIFPSERCMNRVLGLLNDANLFSIWTDDETIGWIYQFFNPPDERKAMRDASAIPINARELAVRNQFFTPRYVVEFLTDNTLGKMWYNMRKGNTQLVNECKFFVRKPNEIFLNNGEIPPMSENETDDLSQEDLLNKPVFISFQPKKDPRDIFILDPACGSGHFLLYSFDLLEIIYLEAWEDTQSPKSAATGHTLREDYPTVESLKKSLPELIVRWNLYGIDIDSRAIQIAALALWLRSQRSWQKQALPISDRLAIKKTNMVCAEPMPGEKDLLQEFSATLQPMVLGHLVEVVFDKMKVVGEVGSLLKIDNEIKDAIIEAQEEFTLKENRQKKLITSDYTNIIQKLPKEKKPSEDFWETAEAKIFDALQLYAEKVENEHSFPKRLFAEDAQRGFGFIDICRKKFDVILMNPPFGSPPMVCVPYLPKAASGNLYSAFMILAIQFEAKYIGCISDRTFTIQASFEDFRKKLLNDVPSLDLLADLGFGVLDADVQVAIYTLTNTSNKITSCLDIREERDKEKLLIDYNKKSRIVPHEVFLRLPNTIFAYNLPFHILNIVEHNPALTDLSDLPRGLGSNKAGRTYLFWAEVPSKSLIEGGRWEPLANGGDFSPYYRDYLGVADWKNPSGKLWVSSELQYKQRLYDQLISESYFQPGLSFPKQSTSFNVALLPSGFLPTREGKAILPHSPSDSWYLLALLNSGPVRAFVRDTCGLHKQSGAIGRIPIPNVSDQDMKILNDAANAIWNAVASSYYQDEASRWFVLPAGIKNKILSTEQNKQEIEQHLQQIEKISRKIYQIESNSEWVEDPGVPILYDPCPDDIISWVIGVIFGRFDVRIANSELPQLNVNNPFNRPPPCSPGMLVSTDGLPAKSHSIISLEGLTTRLSSHQKISCDSNKTNVISNNEYPIPISWDGILVDDSGWTMGQPHCENIIFRVRAVLEFIWDHQALNVEHDICNSLGSSNLQEYLNKPSGFFQGHLKRYSKSRRKAPIYWPLSTRSGMYTIWLYYHRLNDQTLFTVINKFIEPKIKEIERELMRIDKDIKESTGRNAAQLQDQFQRGRAFLAELQDFEKEIKRIATFYNPDLNDGVVINAAPFHKLFRLRSWADETEEVWKNLKNGAYDWSHMAINIRPNEVREACKKDRSIAIAHGLEDLCEIPLQEIKSKKKRGRN